MIREDNSNDFDVAEDTGSDAFGSPRLGSFRRTKSCPFSGKNALTIDYKDVRLLSHYISERGKMIPRRITGVSAKKQRELRQAIQRARFLALIPFENK